MSTPSTPCFDQFRTNSKCGFDTWKELLRRSRTRTGPNQGDILYSLRRGSGTRKVVDFDEDFVSFGTILHLTTT